MTTKEHVLHVLNMLPDDCTIEDVQYHLYVIQTIQKGLKQADEGETIPHSEARRRLAKWLQK